MKKDTAGLAGAARIDQLTLGQLTHAELHGKRLDKTSQSRAINNNPPLTTTGLDLSDLYHRHVHGAFIPKCRAKAMQVVVQFPKDLVDGDDAKVMLQHARAFVEEVFGKGSIFADRIDRDEKSRHVVDVFIAPKYVKKTKHTEKLAVTMSVHQKQLAERYNCPPTPIGTGRALQTALFEYLRDKMLLKGVKRGEPKLIPGPDWKLSEQLRMEELADQKIQLGGREANLDERSQQIEARAERIEAQEVRVEERIRHADRIAAVADADRAAAAAAHQAADAAAQEADANRRAAAAELAEAARQRDIHDRVVAEQRRKLVDLMAAAEADRVEAGRVRLEVEAAYAAITVSQERMTAEARAAEQARHDAEAAHAAALAEHDAAVEIRRQLEERHALHVAQLALLARASDDSNGLDLKASGTAFTMNSRCMTDVERAVHRRPWSQPLIAVAQALAAALEVLRDRARRLAKREKIADEREAAAEAREVKLTRERADHDAQVSAHHLAIVDLDRRRGAAAALEARAEAEIAKAQAMFAAANRTQAEAEALRSNQRRWMQVMDALEATPEWIIIEPNGRLRLDPAVAGTSPPEIRAILREPAPAWAVALAAERLDLADALRRADDRERSAAFATAQLTDMIEKAGSALTPTQQKTVAAATHTVRQFGAAGIGPER